MCPHKLYTIGYSGFTPDEFIEILKKYSIGLVVDVRSAPYSSYFEQYNMDNIKNSLRKNRIYYVFLGDDLGARPKDTSLYSNNIVDFEKISNSHAFRNGCERIRECLEKFSICMMCAEKDPANCHRSILITNTFRKIYPETKILHIHSISKLESQKNIDWRIMSMYKLEQEHFFKNFDERKNEAYTLREKEIAYSDET